VGQRARGPTARRVWQADVRDLLPEGHNGQRRPAERHRRGDRGPLRQQLGPAQSPIKDYTLIVPSEQAEEFSAHVSRLKESWEIGSMVGGVQEPVRRAAMEEQGQGRTERFPAARQGVLAAWSVERSSVGPPTLGSTIRAVEKSAVKRYRGPTIGGTAAVVLGLLGLGLDLPDPLVIAVTAVIVLAALLWAAWIRLWPRAKRATIASLKRELVQPALLQASPTGGGTRQTLDHQEAQAARREVEKERAQRRTQLRLALNKVSEEMEHIDGRISADDHFYWVNYQLPASQWEAWGDEIAAQDHKLHAVLRAVYRQRDTLQYELDRQEEEGVEVVGILPVDLSTWQRVYGIATRAVCRKLEALDQAEQD